MNTLPESEHTYFRVHFLLWEIDPQTYFLGIQLHLCSFSNHRQSSTNILHVQPILNFSPRLINNFFPSHRLADSKASGNVLWLYGKKIMVAAAELAHAWLTSTILADFLPVSIPPSADRSSAKSLLWSLTVSKQVTHHCCEKNRNDSLFLPNQNNSTMLWITSSNRTRFSLGLIFVPGKVEL